MFITQFETFFIAGMPSNGGQMAAHLLTQSGGAQHKIYGGAAGRGGFYKEIVLSL